MNVAIRFEPARRSEQATGETDRVDARPWLPAYSALKRKTGIDAATVATSAFKAVCLAPGFRPGSSRRHQKDHRRPLVDHIDPIPGLVARLLLRLISVY